MNLVIHPGKKLQGVLSPDQPNFRVPGDKSLSHRAALFAALAEGESRVDHFLVSGVTRPLLDALSAVGVHWKLEGETLTVDGRGLAGWKPPAFALHCGNSATTMRLLAGALATEGIPAVLTGSAGLLKRPMNRIVQPLREMGVAIRAAPSGTAPIELLERPRNEQLYSCRIEIPVASAQVKTCLLLAALSASGKVEISEPALSRDHTERMLASQGVGIETFEDRQHFVTRLFPPATPLSPIHMTLPGDFSSAAFLITAALITPGSDLVLKGIGLNPTRTGLLDAFLEMGADIQVSNRREQAGEPVGDLNIRHSRLHGTRVSGPLVVRMIDEFPAFATAALFAEGESRVSGAEELRTKESDRITCLCQEIAGLGGKIQELPDGFIVHGGSQSRGGWVDPHGDHRMAMALALVGLAAQEPVTVRNSQIIQESFPEFPQILQQLGADLCLEKSADE
jgi:3-phosphoshikimate 1-carboxyvinyltransferase